MWKNNLLDQPIPESSSSREAGKPISIPPLRFESPNGTPGQERSLDQLDLSMHTALPLDKLRDIYLDRVAGLRKMIENQLSEENNRKSNQTRQILVKAIYTKDQVKMILMRKDMQYDQLLNEYHQSRVAEEESKINLLTAQKPSMTTLDLIQIISDLTRMISDSSQSSKGILTSKGRQLSGYPSSQGRQKDSSRQQFDNTIDTLSSENEIVAEKLRRLIDRKRGKRGGQVVSNVRSHQQSSNINHKVANFGSLDTKDHSLESILFRIMAEIQGLKSEISTLNTKISSHHLTDNTISLFEREYQKANQKVDFLEQEVEALSKELLSSRSKNSTDVEAKLFNALSKIAQLEYYIEELTANFNRETEELQHRLDHKQKKIRQLTQALQTIQIVNQDKDSAEFENTVSSSVDLLMLEVDRLNKELKKAELEIDGHQLTILRLSKVVELKEQHKQPEESLQDTDLVEHIRQQCLQMASRNEKAIEDLDKQQQIKEQKLKHICSVAAQKSSRTNRSQEQQGDYAYRVQGGSDFESEMIEGLNNKIFHKIEEIKMEREKNMNLEQENLELKEEILFMRGNIEEFQGLLKSLQSENHRLTQRARDIDEDSRTQTQKSQNPARRRTNQIAAIIDGYQHDQKAKMIDCFAVLIKILSDNVLDATVITRCQNLLRCAESSSYEVSQVSSGPKIRSEGSSVLDREDQKKKHEPNVDSIPTLQLPSKKGGVQESNLGHQKTSKAKRKPVG